MKGRKPRKPKMKLNEEAEHKESNGESWRKQFEKAQEKLKQTIKGEHER